MPLLLDTTRAGAAREMRNPNPITIGLINNMPDAAVDATERQFVDLIRAATPDTVIRLKLFSIADVPRADHVRRELAERYCDISELWDIQLDGLIVTGTEPRAAKLEDEPYWAALTKLVDWARGNTASTIWSCLAAHAVVLHTNGIERRLLPEKRFGVFDCDVVVPHPLTQGAAPQLRVPHSRYNDLSARALSSCGYRLLTRSATAGVDMFAKEEPGSSFFLFFQGHPEYEAGTLLREYRRDVGRFLGGELKHYPVMPQGFFNNEATTIANAFREAVLLDRRDDLIASFPVNALEATLESTWRASAIGIYRKWIGCLGARRTDRRTLKGPWRHWRNWPSGSLHHAADRPREGSADPRRNNQVQ